MDRIRVLLCRIADGAMATLSSAADRAAPLPTPGLHLVA